MRNRDLDGQQFQIHNCKGCNIYVHDYHTTSQIYGCSNCYIVMGPCTSSCQIIDTSDCTIVITTQQLRIRGCKNLKIMTYSSTEVCALSFKLFIACP